jgi:hypothetical protein
MEKLAERIKIFAERFYGSQTSFAQEIDEHPNCMYRYTNGQTIPGIEKLNKFYDAGMSIDWLLTGKGSMFASNSKGLDFQKQYEKTEVKDKKKPFERIKRWIIDNYRNLQNYSIVMNLDYNEVHDFLYQDYLMPPSFVQILNKSGCSISWILNGEGDQYSNTPLGLILKENQGERNQAKVKLNYTEQKSTSRVGHNDVGSNGIGSRNGGSNNIGLKYDPGLSEMIRLAIREEIEKHDKEKNHEK